MSFPVKPFRRGFFCDDESIQLPYFDSTVSAITLYSFGLTIPILLIFFIEYVVYVEQEKSTKSAHGKRVIEHYYRSVHRKVVCFVNGAMYGYLLSAVAKFTVGRLRPNFIALCGIDLDSVCRNNARRYVSNFTCPNGEYIADDGRISFPSDHAGFSFYVAVFSVLYLQKRLKFGVLCWKPLLQFSIILLAWWVSLTRVMDNHHHLSDVMVGIFIGTGVAIINTIFVHSFFDDENVVRDRNSNGFLLDSETFALLQNNFNK